eukprot:gene18301-24761_t
MSCRRPMPEVSSICRFAIPCLAISAAQPWPVFVPKAKLKLFMPRQLVDSLSSHIDQMKLMSFECMPQLAKALPQILNGILGLSNVPYSSFVPTPVTPLHCVDARIKLLWLVAIYFMIARSTPVLRLGIAASIGVISMIVFPRRLWMAQLGPLSAFCLFIFTLTALGADGVPPVLQPRAATPLLEGLPSLESTGYQYVLLHIFFITVTQRSLASLCLVTTPGEEMAVGLRWWLSPLKLFGAPIKVQRQMVFFVFLRSAVTVLVFGHNVWGGVASWLTLVALTLETLRGPIKVSRQMNKEEDKKGI